MPHPSAASAATAQRGWPEPGPIQLDLLAINDLHGNLEAPTGSSGRVTEAPPVDAGGAAYLATHLDQLRAKARRGARRR